MSRTIAILAVLFAGLSSGKSGKVSPDLPDGTHSDPIDVIVQFNRPVSPELHERLGRKGGQLHRELSSIRAAVYSMSPAQAAALGDDPDVLYVSPDRPLQPALDNANVTVGATAVFGPSSDGTGVGIAVIDSGVLDARDLLASGSNATNTSRIVYSQSFVKGVSSTLDQYGHGTHVAGIAAGNANASSGRAYFRSFRGIAPNAKIINLRVLDANGAGTDSAVIAAIDRAIQLKSEYNIRVMNISLGRPVFESYKQDPLCQAVERAWNAGITVVVAAGNNGRDGTKATDGYATITSPANDPLVITVGAMKVMDTEYRTDDLIASYSSKGPTLLDHIVKPDIVAPGNRIVSLAASKSLINSSSTTNRIPYSYYESTSTKAYSAEYYRLSGTSMAAAMVSGSAAVMLQNDWSLSPDTVKARLMRSASKTFPSISIAVDPNTGISYTSQYDIFTVGAGYLDLSAALKDSQTVPRGSTAASPVAVYDKNTRTVSIANVETAVWGKAAIWGSTAIWGSATVWGWNGFVDGQAAVWGSSAIWGSAAVWGSGSMQGNAAIWGSSAIWGSTTAPGSEALKQLISGEN